MTNKFNITIHGPIGVMQSGGGEIINVQDVDNKIFCDRCGKEIDVDCVFHQKLCKLESKIHTLSTNIFCGVECRDKFFKKDKG